MNIGMEDLVYKTSLSNFFRNLKLEKRNELMDSVLADRTRYITVALENIYQPHNASAVLRSCDCFGVQDVHIIENSYGYELNPHVSLGAAQWLTLHRHNILDNNTKECIDGLKNDGYRIVATTPDPKAVSIHDFDVAKGKFALLFGTEKFGLTPEAFEMADEYIRIPMYGFTESFNISVSVSLCLFHFTERIRVEKANWQLSEEEQTDIYLQWFRNTITNSEMIERKFHGEYFSK
ncbi:MAG: RNA methyltransferase [Bacteroidales bacterium]|nr:RNA methyltransferase [Bacteroidales bacterium]